MKGFLALGSTVVYLMVLCALYYANIRLLTVDVVFYSSLYVVAVAAAISAVALLALRMYRRYNVFEKLQLICIWVLLGYVLALSVPTVIDRSLSFYILEKLQQRGGGIRLDKFDYIFTSEYMREHRLVDIRLTEQAASGTIRIENGCVKLTPRGERFASFGQFFRRHFLPRKRLLNGEYTDILTDPFRRSDANPDYLCR